MTQENDTLVHDYDEYDDEPTEPEEQPPARPRRRAVPPVAIGLSAVVVAGAGFIGGVQVQKSSGDEAGGGMPAGVRAMMAGGNGVGGSAGSGTTGSSSATTGEVANVKGSKLYVTTTDGTTVEVSVGSKATVQRLAKSSVGQVRPGDSVMVTGTTGSNGTVKASAVQATASGVTLLGGGMGRGAMPGGGAPPEDGANGDVGPRRGRGGPMSNMSDAERQTFQKAMEAYGRNPDGGPGGPGGDR